MKILLAFLAAVALGVIGWLVWPTPPGPLVLRASSVTVTITRPRLGMTDLDISTSRRRPARSSSRRPPCR